MAYDITGSSSFTVTTLLPDYFGPGITLSGEKARFHVKVPVPWRVDPVLGRSPYEMFVVDMDGNRLHTIEGAAIAPASWSLAELGAFSFVLAAGDPQAENLSLPDTEIQLWRGGQLVDWFVIVRADTDGKTANFQCRTLDWYFTRRVVGRVPRENLLINGGFEEGYNKGWDYFSLPRGPIAVAPLHMTSREVAISGEKSLRLEASSGRKESGLLGDNDDWYNGTSLTNAAKNALDGALAEFPDTPIGLWVNVYDDNQGGAKDSLKQTSARAEAVVAYLQARDPIHRYKATGWGEQFPIESNATAAGRKANRRTWVSYKEEVGSHIGHKQCARQRITFRNPADSKRKVTLTASAWVFITEEQGFAYKHYGLVLERASKSKRHPDKKYREHPHGDFKKVFTRKVVPINKSTPVGKWVRMETSMKVPSDGEPYYIDVMLFPPNGVAYWDEVWLTPDEALHYSNMAQEVIMRDLIEHAQDPEMGKSDLKIGHSIPDTGYTRDRSYPFSERGNIYELLQEYNVLANGLEWRMVCTPTTRTVTAWFGEMGEKRGELVLDPTTNVTTFRLDVDGEQISTTVIVQYPEGEGSDREEGTAMDSSGTGGLVLEKVFEGTPGGSISSLDAQAERGLARYRRAIVTPIVDMDPDLTDELLASVNVGDTVTAKFVSLLPDIPDEAEYRITRITLDPRHDRLSFDLSMKDPIPT
jgi:hypothetical protein